MIWKEIVINTNTEGSELVADAFFSIGCSGVKILDRNDLNDIIKNGKHWDYIDEKLFNNSSDIVKVSSFVSEKELDAKVTELYSIISGYDNIGEMTVVDVDDEQWSDSWKRYYSPIVAESFVVVPKWIKYENDGTKTEIYIDPGMAFGTGEHESTKMCLMLMSELEFEGKSVIDVGTGSGILGIGAIKKGAKSCYMCDIDSVAVSAAEENASLNNIRDNVEIEMADLLNKKEINADILLANLTADILIILSKSLKNHLREGGLLVCSGIINSQLGEVVKTFVDDGYTVEKNLSMGEWNALLLRR